MGNLQRHGYLYRMQVRLKLYGLFACLLVSTAIGAQSLFLVAGQSNAVGVGNSDSSAVYQCSSCYEFSSATQSCWPLKDPVGYNAPNEDFQAAVSGSAWPAFAYTFHQLTNDSVILVQAAKGGTSCHALADGGAGNWSNGYHLFSQAVTKAKAAEAFTGKQLDGIVWLQGESDAIGIYNGKISACQYKQALQDLIQRFRNQLHCNLPFYIIQTGLFTEPYDDVFNQVREIQKQLAEEDYLTFIVDSTANSYRSLGWMTDQIHFDQRALNAMGTNAAYAIYLLKGQYNFDSCYTITTAPLSPDWAVYPSPFKEELTIEVRNFTCADLEVQLTDLKGRKLLQDTYRCSGTLPILKTINTQALQPGMYIATVQLNKQYTITQKVVKE